MYNEINIFLIRFIDSFNLFLILFILSLESLSLFNSLFLNLFILSDLLLSLESLSLFNSFLNSYSLFLNSFVSFIFLESNLSDSTASI